MDVALTSYGPGMSQHRTRSPPQLSNILELAGMGKHIDFDEQVTSSDNKARPDVVVKIPGGAKVPIDAKFPLVTDQEHATDQVNDETRREYANRILNHAKELGKRNYPDALDAVLDFTVMFLPVAPILDEALTANPDLWDKALRDHQVLIATPWMLVAFLRTVSVSWQQDEMAKNTKEILKAGTEMLDRLRVYAEHVDRVGVNLRQAMDAHNSSVSSLEVRVFPQAKRFEQYGVTAPKPIPELEQLDTTPKSFRTP